MSVLPPPVPPGWYPDPSGTAEFRWWDGRQWTDDAAVDGQVLMSRLRREPGAGPVHEPDRRLVLPTAAAAWAVAGCLLGLVLANVAGVVLREATGELVLMLLGSQLMLWAGMLGGVAFVSRRFGTGDVVADLQLRMERRDIGVGLLASLAARLAVGVVAAVVIVVVGEDEALAADQFGTLDESRAALLLALVFAVVGAPVIEELFFRGVLLRALEPSLGRSGAVVAQAGLFGMAHVVSSATLVQNVILVGGVAVAGAIFAVLVQRSGRLGPAVWAHLFFNLVPVVYVLATDF